jgi:hypothetical protein
LHTFNRSRQAHSLHPLQHDICWLACPRITDQSYSAFEVICNSTACRRTCRPRQMAPSQRRRRRSALTTANGRNTRQRLLLPAEAAPPSLDCGSELTSQAASCGVDTTTVTRTAATDAALAAAAAATAAVDVVPLASSQVAAQPPCPQPTSQPDEAGHASGTRSGSLRRMQSGGLQMHVGGAAEQLMAPVHSNIAIGSQLQGEASDGASPLQQGSGGAGPAATASQPLAVRPSLQLAPASEQHGRPDSARNPRVLAAAEPGSSNPNDGADATTPLPATRQLSALQESPAPTELDRPTSEALAKLRHVLSVPERVMRHPQHHIAVCAKLLQLKEAFTLLGY